MEETNKTPIDKLVAYQRFANLYSTEIETEIEKSALDFYTIGNESKRTFEKLYHYIISSIVGHPKFKLDNEDQLLDIIDDLYQKNCKYADLYREVLF